MISLGYAHDIDFLHLAFREAINKRFKMRLVCSPLFWTAVLARAPIDRHAIVQSFNPVRNQSSAGTPLQVGNGNFAFGVDITGLQTFSPFATLSTWAWHNNSLPTTPGQTDPSGKV